jgi:hypothetical protein
MNTMDPHSLTSEDFKWFWRCTHCGKELCRDCWNHLNFLPFFVTSFSILRYIPLVSIMSVLITLLTYLGVDFSILNINWYITGYYYIDLFITVVLPWVTYLKEKKKHIKLLIFLHNKVKYYLNKPILVTSRFTFVMYGVTVVKNTFVGLRHKK